MSGKLCRTKAELKTGRRLLPSVKMLERWFLDVLGNIAVIVDEPFGCCFSWGEMTLNFAWLFLLKFAL